MRRVRAAVVMAGIAAATLIGAGSPAQASPEPSRNAAVVTSGYQFGMYYYEWACHYFGNSLVTGGAFRSYSCYYQYYQPDNASYWFLYVY
jgi:hypothetical protein